MPPSILDPKSATQLAHRIRSLSPEATRHWGTMTPGAMFCHIADAMEQSLGRRSDVDKSNLFSRTIFKFLMVRVFPMPKGAPTSPRMDSTREGTCSGDFEADRRRVLDLLEELRIWPEEMPMAAHPFFGPLTKEERGLLTWKHIDYHLRQFGG